MGDHVKEFSFTPRDYQLRSRYRCNEILNKKGHPLLVLDTGLGKTKTLFMIIFFLNISPASSSNSPVFDIDSMISLTVSFKCSITPFSIQEIE